MVSFQTSYLNKNRASEPLGELDPPVSLEKLAKIFFPAFKIRNFFHREPRKIKLNLMILFMTSE